MPLACPFRLPAEMSSFQNVRGFSVGHATSGWPNIIVALIAGSILAVFYQWRRDLLANMIGHFLVDFIGVVIRRFFS